MIGSAVRELHQFFNDRTRYAFPIDGLKSELPKSGLYIVFEKGERYLDFDRIVRVGTHTGDGNLYRRLCEHFIKENKNRSIFRKNLGRCFLNRDGHPYLKSWDLDTTSREAKERGAGLIDPNFERVLEERISDYIRSSLTFCVLGVDSKDERLFWESKIASTLRSSSDFEPSDSWLGLQSPKAAIRETGLWQEQMTSRSVLDSGELERLLQCSR